MNITKFLNKLYFAPRHEESDNTPKSHTVNLTAYATALVGQRQTRNGERSMTMPLSVLMKISRSAFPYKLTKK